MIIKNIAIPDNIQVALGLRHAVLQDIQTALKRIRNTPHMGRNQDWLLRELRFLHEKMLDAKAENGEPIFSDRFIYQKLYQAY